MTRPPRIAIVGMACRYPDATDAGELWQTVLGRRRGFRRLPADRLGEAYHGSKDEPDTTYVTHAGLLRGWSFDRERFGVPGPLYRAVDHTHWLALQVAAEALVDAGFPDAEGLDRDRVGVILGNTLTGEFARASQLRLRWPFVGRVAAAAMAEAGISDEQIARAISAMEDLVKRPFPVPSDESLAGGLANTIAGRVCNYFDFHGTGYTVDGACSSSLLSVMAACRALAAGELDFALAGGVDLSLDPFELVGFARMGALAVDEMRIYDAAPTGFLPGEGCGVVALVRADDAERAGMRCYATLIGWGTSSDGAGGLTRPKESGQVKAALRAYEMAQIGPDSVDLIEGHGTGTAVGDAVELTALSHVRGAGAAKAALGSIKANIGHTKAAAGVAGMIKAALAIHRRVLPPTTGCRELHQLLRERDIPLRILAEPEPWPTSLPRACVSSMGFGGINTHVIVEGSPAHPVTSLPTAVQAWSRPSPPQEIVLLTADSIDELGARLHLMAERAATLSSAELGDLAATEHQSGQVNQANKAVRCALVAATPERLSQLAQAARERIASWDGHVLVDESGYVLSSGSQGRVGVLFPGQAAPVRAELDCWAAPLDVPPVPGGLRIRDGDTDTAVAQPAIIRQSLAGLAWLTAMGCQAVGAVGHSVGEVAALVWAGAMSPTEGLLFASERGRLMAEHGQPGTTMASIGVDVDRTHQLLSSLDVTVSGVNAPTQTTVSGREDVIGAAVAKAHRAGIPAIVLPVSHGFHSEAMRPVREPLRHWLRQVGIREPSLSVFSTVTGKLLHGNPADVLIEQLTLPVRFVEALKLLAGRCDLLVEVGPGTTLTNLASACGVNVPAVAMDCGATGRHALATAAIVAVGAGDLTPWFDGRMHRTLSLDTPISLLTNPCETTTAPPRALLERPAVVPESPEPPLVSDGDPLQVLREHLSRTLELPMRSIQPDSSFLGDLHLNSLQLANVMTEVSGLLGKAMPAMPMSMAAASVGEAAQLLASGPDATPERDAPLAGVRDWVRMFEHDWKPVGDSARRLEDVQWTVHAPEGHWLHETAARRSSEGRSGLAILLDGGVPEVAAMLRRIAQDSPAFLAVLHHGHPAAAALARSAVVELPSCAATVVQLPPDASYFDLGSVALDGYQELRVDPDGGVCRIGTNTRESGGRGDIPLDAGDVCLVTGGTTGITAYCAAELAARTGCILVLLGRSPVDHPPVQAGLSALGPHAHYVQCNVSDRDQVRAALAALRAFGPVRGLLHGAGVNVPRPMVEVTADSLEAMVAPKVGGLRTLLAEIGTQLRVVVGFGSIIGRRGLSGQSEYCVANDWMRHEMLGWSSRFPLCRSRMLEWSAWSEIGMGPRMGVLDNLRAQGIVPIAPTAGAEAMIAALKDEHAPVTLLVTGRFPAGPTLTVEGPVHRPLRFCDEMPIRTAGVEAVIETSISLGSDPYLDEHRIETVPVLPAAIGLEAMAQAAAAAVGELDHYSFTDIELHAPVTVDELDSRTMRIAALATHRNEVDVVLRDDADGFAADRFTATMSSAQPEPSRIDGAIPPSAAQPHAFYGPLYFHTGRFRRVIRYEHLSAFGLSAWIQADARSRWFSQFHDQRLLLGDPGAHDASLHVLLACLPHRRAVPVAADRMTVWRKPSGMLRVLATERHHTVDDCVFDVDVVNADGHAVARWDGLRLRALGPRNWTEPIPIELVGPILSRRLIERGLADNVELVTSAEGVVVRSAFPVGVHWEMVSPNADELDTRLVRAVANKAAEGLDAAATRVRCARRALSETSLGERSDQSLVIDEVTEDSMVVLRAGQIRITTARLATSWADPLVVAVATIDRS